MTSRLRTDDGAAMVEFTFLAVLLLVPLAYVVVAAFTVQRAAFAVTAATREAGRAFVTTPAGGDPDARAAAAAALALRDQGLTLVPGTLAISCEAAPCLTPGARVRVALDYTVELPLLPRALAGQPLGGIVVRGRHAQVVDEYRELP